jgi:hypothetical protein
VKLRTLAIAAGVVLGAVACQPAPGVGGAPAPSGRSPAAHVVQVPSSIDATGRTDVTQQLTDFLASLQPNTTVEFPADGRYDIEGTVVIRGAKGLTLDFNGAQVFARTDGEGVTPPGFLKHLWPRHRAHLFVVESRDITIKEMHFRGSNEHGGTSDEAYVRGLEAQNAIELDRVRGALIEGNDLAFMHGDGVDVARDSSDILIRGNRIRHTGRQGVAVTGGTRITIVGNFFDQIRRSVIDVEPHNDNTIQTIRILENTVGDAVHEFVAAVGRGGHFDDLEISRNYLFEHELKIYVKTPRWPHPRRTNVTITDNVSTDPYGSPKAAIQIFAVDGVTITGNTQPLNPRQSAVFVETSNSCYVHVAGNDLPGMKLAHLTDNPAWCPTMPPPPPIRR